MPRLWWASCSYSKTNCSNMCVYVSGMFFIFIAMCFIVVLVLGCGGSCILSYREHMDPDFMSMF
jgi:heme/copper-type cytochrome/quinol oxidase subunit 2